MDSKTEFQVPSFDPDLAAAVILPVNQRMQSVSLHICAKQIFFKKKSQKEDVENKFKTAKVPKAKVCVWGEPDLKSTDSPRPQMVETKSRQAQTEAQAIKYKLEIKPQLQRKEGPRSRASITRWNIHIVPQAHSHQADPGCGLYHWTGGRASHTRPLGSSSHCTSKLPA